MTGLEVFDIETDVLRADDDDAVRTRRTQESNVPDVPRVAKTIENAQERAGGGGQK